MTQKRERFEDHLKQVEEAVRALESGRLGLDESMEQYEAGIAALRHCQKLLDDAELKIKALVAQKDGTLLEESFAAGEDEAKPAKKAARPPKPKDDIPF